MTSETITAAAEALLSKLATLGAKTARSLPEFHGRCLLAHRQVEEAYIHAGARGDETETAQLAEIAAALEAWLVVLR